MTKISSQKFFPRNQIFWALWLAPFCMKFVWPYAWSEICKMGYSTYLPSPNSNVFILSNFGLNVLSKKSTKFANLQDFHWSQWHGVFRTPRNWTFRKKKIFPSQNCCFYQPSTYVKISNIGMAKQQVRSTLLPEMTDLGMKYNPSTNQNHRNF